MTYLLDQDIAERAINLGLPSIKGMMDAGVAKRPHLHIVVSLRSSQTIGQVGNYRAKSRLVLAERSLGNVEEWEYPYDKVAFSKFDISDDTGLPSRLVQATMPEVLQVEYTVYGGSAIRPGSNLIVACLGVQSEIDETFAEIIRAIAVGLTGLKQNEIKESGVDFYNT